MSKVIRIIMTITIIGIMFSTLINIGTIFAAKTSSDAQSKVEDVTPTETNTDFQVSVGSTEGKVGDIVTVPISYVNVPKIGTDLCTMTITYDPTQLEYISGEAGPLVVDSDVSFILNKESDGKINIGYFDPFMGEYYIQSDGVLANLNFKITGFCDETPLKITNATVLDLYSGILNPTLNDGVVYIKKSEVSTSDVYKFSGYIEPDFLLSTLAGPKARQGFKVELVGTAFNSLTDSNGYFEIKDVPTGEYDIEISKTYYLPRQIANISVDSDKQLSTQSIPLSLWIGDLKEDGAINMEDIMILSKSFNSIAGGDNYEECRDLNFDGAINMEDIIIVAKHFNNISSDY